jgi:hypothetical protein
MGLILAARAQIQSKLISRLVVRMLSIYALEDLILIEPMLIMEHRGLSLSGKSMIGYVFYRLVNWSKAYDNIFVAE